MVDSWSAMVGAAILMFGVFFFAHIVGGLFISYIHPDQQSRHIGLMNFAMLFTIFFLLAIKL